MGTIADLNELTAPNPSTHYLMVRTDAASDKDKKMKLGVFPLKYAAPAPNTIVRWRDANTIEASAITLTGTGSLAVGGVSSINGNLTGGGTIALGTFTLTAPATGIAALKTGTPVAGRVASWLDSNTLQGESFAASDVALKSLANTFALAQTFNGGLIPGSGQDNIALFSKGTWPIGFLNQGTAVFSGTTGDYIRFGGSAAGTSIVFFGISLTITTAGSGTGALRITLPFPVASPITVNTFEHSGLDLTLTGAVGVVFEVEVGTSQGICRVMYDNTGFNNVLGNNLLLNGLIRISGFYFA